MKIKIIHTFNVTPTAQKAIAESCGSSIPCYDECKDWIIDTVKTELDQIERQYREENMQKST